MTLIEFCGLPGTGKSTLALAYATEVGAILLRIDTIEAAMFRHGLRPAQTGIAAYAVAHDVAAGHLPRGMTVVVDAVSPVEAARAGWRELATAASTRHVVIETRCPDDAEHRRRIEHRIIDIPDLPRPNWSQVQRTRAQYEPRTDERLALDTTGNIADCLRQVADYVRSAATG